MKRTTDRTMVTRLTERELEMAHELSWLEKTSTNSLIRRMITEQHRKMAKRIEARKQFHREFHEQNQEEQK